jgi:hypothetical protein
MSKQNKPKKEKKPKPPKKPDLETFDDGGQPKPPPKDPPG